MRFTRLILAVVLALFSSFFVTPSASAHTELVNTSPIDGAEIDVAPAVISLTFSDPVLEVGTAIVLNQADGTEVELGELTFEGATVSASAPADLTPGEYTVTWRAAADDGHVQTGEFAFTFNGTVVAVDSEATALPMAQSGIDEEETNENSNSWIILLASFVASATIGTIYATKKRK
ncbi:MAG: hypothetical protein RL355_764 [Actinomycetota bacterium]|jgi:methionine-rich copper-binding protein CopC